MKFLVPLSAILLTACFSTNDYQPPKTVVKVNRLSDVVIHDAYSPELYAIPKQTDAVVVAESVEDAQRLVTENEQQQPPEPQYVTFALTSGRIKPQVERLLKEHFDNSPGLVWDLDENLYYQGEFELKGDSYHHILHRINLSYGAKAIWFGNNWVRIIPNN